MGVRQLVAWTWAASIIGWRARRGAFDFIRKSDGPDATANAILLRQQLFAKIDLFAQRRARPSLGAAPQTKPAAAPPIHRPGRFHAVAIGSSTGGPEALARLLPFLTKQASVPLFIVQHLPTGMTGYFAESLGRKCDYQVVEAVTARPCIRALLMSFPVGGTWSSGIKKAGRHALNDQPRRMDRPSVDVFFVPGSRLPPRSSPSSYGMGCDAGGSSAWAATRGGCAGRGVQRRLGMFTRRPPPIRSTRFCP